MRPAVRIVLAGVAAVLMLVVIVVAFWTWYAYDNAQPLNMAAIAQSPPVRSAEQVIAARLAADAAALGHGAPWLIRQDRMVTDSCSPAGFSDNVTLFSANAEQWQCTRRVVEVFGVIGSMRARRTALAADLSRDGWAEEPVQSPGPAYYLQWASPGQGQVDEDNRGAGGTPVGELDLTVFWARRPAVLKVYQVKPEPAPFSLVNPAIRRAYGRYAQVVIFFYTGTYAAGTGRSVSSTPAPPPPTPGPGPCGGGGYNC